MRHKALICSVVFLALAWGCAKEESCDPVGKVKFADSLIEGGGIEDSALSTKAQSLYTEALNCSNPEVQSDLEFVQSHAHFGLAFISLFQTVSVVQQALTTPGVQPTGGASGQCVPTSINAQGPGGISFRSVIVPLLKSTIEPIIGNFEEVIKYPGFSMRFSKAKLVIFKENTQTKQPEISLSMKGSYDLGEVYFLLGLTRVIEGALDYLFAYDGVFDSIVAGLSCPQYSTNPLLDPAYGKLASDGPDLLIKSQGLLGGGFDAWAKGVDFSMHRISDSFADGWIKDTTTGMWKYNALKDNTVCDGCVGDPNDPNYTGEYYVDRNGNGQYDDVGEHFFYFRDWGVPQTTSAVTIPFTSIGFTIPASYPSSREPDGKSNPSKGGVFSPNPLEWNPDPTGDNHPCSLQEIVNGTPCGERDGIRQRGPSGKFIEDLGWEGRNKSTPLDLSFLFPGLIVNINLAAGPDDTGPDGLHDWEEPGYDPDCNPDPSNEDAYVGHIFYPLLTLANGVSGIRPSACMVEGLTTCFEGDGIWEPGEPFRDYGTDNIRDKYETGPNGPYRGSDPDGDDYDPLKNPRGRENNGKYDRGEPWGSTMLTRVALLALKLNPGLLSSLGSTGESLTPLLNLPQTETIINQFLEPILGAALPLDTFGDLWKRIASSIKGKAPLDITPLIPGLLTRVTVLLPSGTIPSSYAPLVNVVLGKITPYLLYMILNPPAVDMSVVFTRHVDDLKTMVPLYYTESEPYTDLNGNGKYDQPEPLAEGWFSAPTSGWYQFPNLNDGLCHSCSPETVPCRGTSCNRFVFLSSDPNYEGSWYDDLGGTRLWSPGVPFSAGVIHIPKAGWQNVAALVNGAYDTGTCYAVCTPVAATTLTTSPTYVGEWYQDTNGNGQWDPGEPFQDLNNDGQWNAAGTLIVQRESEVAFHPKGEKCSLTTESGASVYCSPDPSTGFPGDPYNDTGIDRVADRMEKGYSPTNRDPSMDNVDCDESPLLQPYTPFPILCGEKNKRWEGWNGDFTQLLGLLGPTPVRDPYHVWPDLRAIDDPNTFKVGLLGINLISVTINDSAYAFYPDPTFGGLILFPAFHIGNAFSVLTTVVPGYLVEGGFPCGRVTYASTMTNGKMNQISGCIGMIGTAASGCSGGGGCPGGGCTGGCTGGCAGGGCGGGCPPGACPFGTCGIVQPAEFEIGVNLHALFIPIGLLIVLKRGLKRRLRRRGLRRGR